MEQQTLMGESVFGKVPLQREKQLVIEAYHLMEGAYSRSILPTVAFDKEKIHASIIMVKRKLEEIGV